MSLRSVSLLSHLSTSGSNASNRTSHRRADHSTNNTAHSTYDSDIDDDLDDSISTYNAPTNDSNTTYTQYTQYNKQLIKQRFLDNSVIDTLNKPFQLHYDKSVTFESTSHFSSNTYTSHRLQVLHCTVINASYNLPVAKRLLSDKSIKQQWIVHSKDKQHITIKLHQPSLLGIIKLNNRSTKHITVYASLYKPGYNEHILYNNNKLCMNRINYAQCGYMPVQYIRIVFHTGMPISLNSIHLIGVQCHYSMFDSDESMQYLTVVNPIYHHMLFGDQTLQQQRS